ncbi:MerR family transcriptional regulator [Ilumatobacter sp.]|uniref:MerR family transcriptional regulator n=1 Tax=Ilumatobacter sp. TaxID=1967498 RepID=UPI003B522195
MGEAPDDEAREAAAAIPDEGFSGTRSAKVVGITYRQLDYWARTDLIRPSIADAEGSGSRRKYSYNDLLELKAIKKLLDAGIKLEQVRKVFEYLREHVTTDIASAHIVIDGGSVNLYDDGQLIDVLQRGQGVLNVLSMGGVKSELEDDLRPDPVVPATPEPGAVVRRTG